MRETFLPFSLPFIGDDEVDEVADTLRSGWLTSGPKTAQFQEEFRKFVDAPAALALNSCTAGLHLALVAGGVAPGDEVITTPMTFAASANVIEHVGATVVLADVERDTLNIDPERVAAAITPRTTAIIAVHFAGHPADLDALRSIADAHGLSLIEDAAHAVGAAYRDIPIGAGTTPVAFSFYATKNMTTGEGGLLTGTPDFIDRARPMSLHGLTRPAWSRDGRWRYDVVEPGFKYNMMDIQAALGIQQLRRLPEMQQRRRAIANIYRREFAGEPALELPVSRPEVTHAWHLFVVRLNLERLTITRDQFIELLRERNIGTSVHFVPIPLHSYYRDKYGFRPQDYPVAMQCFERLVSLPLSPAMTDADVADVVDAVRDVCAENRKNRPREAA